jgi:hypothetical protein
VPALRGASQPPPLPRAITARRAAGQKKPERPRLLRRATTYGGNR